MKQHLKIKRFVVLDALRGLAALMVFLYHMPNSTWLTNNSFINSSFIFVDLFFVISGFVIYHNYKDKINCKVDALKFLNKRIKRLYPLHIYTLLVLIIAEVFKLGLASVLPFQSNPFSYESLKVLLINTFLLNSTPLFQDFSWNGQSWSISAEFFCYILFIVVSIYFFKTKHRVLSTALIVLILGYLFFYISFGSLDIVLYYKYSFIRGIIGFFVGVLVYNLKEYKSNSKHATTFLKASLLELFTISLMVIITINTLNVLIDYYIIHHLVFGWCIYLFSLEKGLISRFLKAPIFQNLGKWSYSIYLNHLLMILVYKMLFIKLVKLEGFLLLISEILLIIITCLYSKYTYKYVEKRFYKKLDKANS